MSTTSTFGTWLRQRRRSHDLTQADLANLVGCALGTLRNIETDRARPSKLLAARLAQALGVPDAEVADVVAFARELGHGGQGQPAVASSEPRPAPPRASNDHLPAQMTGLIGRAREVAEVRALLERPDVRLVTLTGPGGTGKTRVAVASALALADAFPDGLFFVDLAALTDPALVLATVAQTLGVGERAGQPLRLSLAAALREQRCLLLLDNFEQVVAAGPQIAALLGDCPQLKLLTTSRIPLGLMGEYEQPVPPLALPDRDHLPPFGQLTQYESLRLFTERAQAATSQFAITTVNAPAVAEICHRLDGLPLAIELVAGWVKLFQPQALLQRLDRRLTFLTGGGHDRPTRQQTIRNTIAWSYQLLTPAEQALLRRLSVFVGGAALGAIDAICGTGRDPDDLANGVGALVNGSLLRALPPGAGAASDAEPRFGMLETIREYALEQLAADADGAEYRARHARYFAALAEAAIATWDSAAVGRAVAQLNREHDNIRAAVQWALDGGHTIFGLQLAVTLRRFWQSRGFISEGRGWLSQLLDMDTDSRDPEVLRARARGLHTAAWMASDQHDYARATQLFEASMALRRELGVGEDEAHLLAPSARQARAAGEYRHALAILENVVAQHRAIGDRGALSSGGLGLSLYELGLALREQGQFERATALFEECLALHRDLGDREGIAVGLLGLGDIARDQGDVPRLRRFCTESLALSRALGVQWALGFAVNNLALGALMMGELELAQTQADEVVTLFRGLQADGALAEVLLTLGMVQQAQGRYAAAEASLTEALQLAWVIGPRLLVAFAAEALAGLAAAQGSAQAAVELVAAAATDRARMGTPVRPLDQPALERTLAVARAALGESAFAEVWAAAEQQPLAQVLRPLLDADRAAAVGA